MEGRNRAISGALSPLPLSSPSSILHTPILRACLLPSGTMRSPRAPQAQGYALERRGKKPAPPQPPAREKLAGMEQEGTSSKMT